MAVLGKDEPLKIYDDDEITPYLEGLDQEERRDAGASGKVAETEAGSSEGASADDTSAPTQPEDPTVS